VTATLHVVVETHQKVGGVMIRGMREGVRQCETDGVLLDATATAVGTSLMIAMTAKVLVAAETMKT